MPPEMSPRRLKFEGGSAVRPEFYPTLKKRVDTYFRERGRGRKANAWMMFKIVFCLGLFFGLYALILSDRFSTPVMLALVLLFGMASALVGFNIAHDAVHGALFTSRRLNRI